MHDSLRPATEHDLKDLAPRLRAEDVAELHAATGAQAEPVLRTAAALSHPHAWVMDDTPGAACLIGGIVPHTHGGIVWLMGTDEAARHRIRINRLTLVLLPRLLKEYGRIYNMVHAKNTASLTWLGWLGFTLGPPRPYGAHGEPFHFFMMEA